MDKETIILVLSCLGIAQALFICIYLITLKRKDGNATFFLAFVILGLTIRIGKSVLNVYMDLQPWQRNLGLSGILLTGPFLWFYGKVLLSPLKTIPRKDYLHLVPFALFALLCDFIPNTGSLTSYIIYLMVFGHLAVYVGLSFKIFYQYQGKVHQQRAKWFRNLVLGVGLIWVFYMGNLAGIFSYYIGGALFFSLLIYIFSFLFLQKHAFQLGKYNTSTLDSSASERLMEQVKTLFIDQQVFLENTISLESIAKKMEISPRKLSQVINENEQTNFSDFVNSYRIEKAKVLLTDSSLQNEKIIAIAYDCGFGNVTSFNLAFKAKTQLTPTQYRNKFKGK
ncbi:helix-turn-helix domain-containing protein [uncultured Allomuricauda sp.]|uniref:helix-turn-helix domain-containing protein n=1 Tax=Flagellimonas sp. W118 TaxID=3410791 RepID=UPI002634FBF4|nr:AraC family transcriptional regulator [uncultured Allomuricauda sp.]